MDNNILIDWITSYMKIYGNTGEKRYLIGELVSLYGEYSPLQRTSDLLYNPIRMCSFCGYPAGSEVPVDEETKFRIIVDKLWLMSIFRKLIRGKNYLPFRVFVWSEPEKREVEICLIHLEETAKDIDLLRFYVRSMLSENVNDVKFLTILYQELWNFEVGENHHLGMYRELSEVKSMIMSQK